MHMLFVLNIGSYRSADPLLNSLNKFRKEIEYEACGAFYIFSATK